MLDGKMDLIRNENSDIEIGNPLESEDFSKILKRSRACFLSKKTRIKKYSRWYRTLLRN